MDIPNSEHVASLRPQDVAVQRLMLEITRSLVHNEEALTVEILQQEGIRTLRVRTDADGFGRLIGSQGRTVRAIRTILGAASVKLQQSYSLDIREQAEPDDGRHPK